MLANKSILFIIQRLNCGGAGKMIHSVACDVLGTFKSVSILSIFDDTPPTNSNDQIEYYAYGVDYSRSSWRILVIRKIREIIKEKQFDYVCTFVSDACVISRIATIGLGTTTVSCERGDPYSLPWKWKYPVRWAYKKSDYCVFQLQHACDYFPAHVKEHSFVIPNCFCPKIPDGPYWGERHCTIVGAGRLCSEKRFDLLIKAFSFVHAQHPQYKLIIYGEGEELTNLQSLVESLEISSFVEFKGHSNNLEESIRKEGIFVLPSDFEGIPNSLIEAISTGIPCVSTNCSPGGPYFLLGGGKNGRIVPTNDYAALASAICNCIEHQDESKEMARNAINILNDLSPNIIRDRWINAFLEMENEKNKQRRSRL